MTETMTFVYVLRSLKNKKRYIGSTRLKPEERLRQHHYGSNQWTSQNGPFELIHSEQFATYSEARKREFFLKSGVGRKFLDEILNQGNNSVSAEGGSASGGG
jgi:putative endonuclease